MLFCVIAANRLAGVWRIVRDNEPYLLFEVGRDFRIAPCGDYQGSVQ